MEKTPTSSMAPYLFFIPLMSLQSKFNRHQQPNTMQAREQWGEEARGGGGGVQSHGVKLL